MGGFDPTTGRFTAPIKGYYFCAAQLRMDAIGSTYTRLIIALNGDQDYNNGLHAIDGNSGSTDYRTLNVAGSLLMKKGDYVSAYVYSAHDSSWNVQGESGFSCHLVVVEPRLNGLM